MKVLLDEAPTNTMSLSALSQSMLKEVATSQVKKTNVEWTSISEDDPRILPFKCKSFLLSEFNLA